ncbi:hypothetical protein C8R44DRAFT_777001 [Mycena epipterygia]|nr:hypothetical protein C8R44DRAFT_777001 [Mycena epipterygia]
MSFVQPRPASPPPRSFSPAIVLAPLPPPVRRRTPSAPRPAHLSLEATRARTKSDRSLRLDKTLASARSCGELRTPATPRSARSVVSAPPTPRSIAPSSPSDSSFRRTHKRNLSFAVPYRSPPASPTIASPPPPVPRIPEFVLSPTDKKPVLHTPAPPPTRVEHIYLPDWEQFAVVPDFAPRKPQRTSMFARRSAAPSTPMTCSSFFALRSTNERPNQVAAL